MCVWLDIITVLNASLFLNEHFDLHFHMGHKHLSKYWRIYSVVSLISLSFLQFLSCWRISAPTEQSGSGHHRLEDCQYHYSQPTCAGISEADSPSLIPYWWISQMECCHPTSTACHVLSIQCRHVYQGIYMHVCICIKVLFTTLWHFWSVVYITFYTQHVISCVCFTL